MRHRQFRVGKTPLDEEFRTTSALFTIKRFTSASDKAMLRTSLRTYCMDNLSKAISWRWLSKPTVAESAMIDSLRAGLSQASLPKADGSEAERAWVQRRIALRDLVLTKDPRRLLSWDIWETFCGRGNSAHLRELRGSPDWDTYLEPALREPPFGQPPRRLNWPWAGSFRIWQAFVLLELYKLGEKRVADFSFILEFGGGYGALCALAYSLGFRGTYVIFDLPEFCLLQTYYLRSLGLPVQEQGKPSASPLCTPPNVVVVSDLDELERWLRQLTGPSLFLSVLGLTDTSTEFRGRFLPLLACFEVLYFLYQPQFREVDNLQWRDQLKCKLDSFKWLDKQPPILGQNRLLLGRRCSAVLGSVS